MPTNFTPQDAARLREQIAARRAWLLRSMLSSPLEPVDVAQLSAILERTPNDDEEDPHTTAAYEPRPPGEPAPRPQWLGAASRPAADGNPVGARYVQIGMTRRRALTMSTAAVAAATEGRAGAASAPARLFEQPLERDPETRRRWRFGRYQRPLAATLRVYADGQRLRQGPDYTFGHDARGWYVAYVP